MALSKALGSNVAWLATISGSVSALPSPLAGQLEIQRYVMPQIKVHYPFQSVLFMFGGSSRCASQKAYSSIIDYKYLIFSLVKLAGWLDPMLRER
jgi:hypothetical protein